MHKTKAASTESTGDRIEAEPGTAEYNRQFRRQALQAADASLSLWVVRIPCGLFALSMAVYLVAGWRDASLADMSGLLFTFYLAFAIVECGGVALRGKSMYLRFMLSGVNRKHAESDGGNDAG